MTRAFLAIARVAFLDATRSPSYGLLLLVALAAQALGPALAMFGFEQDAALQKEFSVSTVLLVSAVLTGLGASAVTARELRSGAADALLSKPVARWAWVAGKFAGLVLAWAVAAWLLLVVLLLAARQGPPASATHPWDGPVVAGGLAGAAIGIALSAVVAVRSSRPFGHVALLIGGGFLSAGLLLPLLFDPAWRLQAPGGGFDPELVKATFLAFLGGGVLAAVAVLLSIVAGRAAFPGTIVAFLLGLGVSGADSPWLGWVPAIRVFWVGEVFYRPGTGIPPRYLLQAGLYAASYSLVCLLVGTWILNRREVRPASG